MFILIEELFLIYTSEQTFRSLFFKKPKSKDHLDNINFKFNKYLTPVDSKWSELPSLKVSIFILKHLQVLFRVWK